MVSSLALSPRKAMTDPSMTWKLVFLSTFLLLSNTILGPHFTTDERLGVDPSIPIISVYGYLLGGFFVGFGARLGNGCTTGHGICGMARLSKRSIVSVCTFMASAFAMATLTATDNKATSKGTQFLRTDTVPNLYNRWLGFGISMVFVAPTLFAIYFNFLRKKSSEGERKQMSSETVDEESGETKLEAVKNLENPSESSSSSAEEAAQASQDDSRRKLLPAALAATLFAVGLAVGEMVLPSKLIGFLNLYLFSQGTYDPTLLTVMVGGCIVSWISYQFAKPYGLLPNKYAYECPLVTQKWSVPSNKIIDVNLLVGAMCFGIGWGVTGLCPGPAIYLAATGTWQVIVCWWPAFLLGSFIAEQIKDIFKL